MMSFNFSKYHKRISDHRVLVAVFLRVGCSFESFWKAVIKSAFFFSKPWDIAWKKFLDMCVRSSVLRPTASCAKYGITGFTLLQILSCFEQIPFIEWASLAVEILTTNYTWCLGHKNLFFFLCAIYSKVHLGNWLEVNNDTLDKGKKTIVLVSSKVPPCYKISPK